MAPWTEAVRQRETDDRLLTPLPANSASDAMPQQLAFITLGGLRTLGAAILKMDAAVDCMDRKDWPMVAKRFDQITALAPHIVYYWIEGADYLSNNAAPDVRETPSLSESERIRASRMYYRQALALLRKGIDNNPKSWELYNALGRTLSIIRRGVSPDFAAAAAAYGKAAALGGGDLPKRQEFYCLARAKGKEREAWNLGKQLFRDPDNRLPVLVCCLFVLQNKLHLPKSERIPFRELFPTDARAKTWLTRFLHNDLRHSTDGIREELERLRALPKKQENK
ncbi:tetratricopeptide-like helical domain [Akkermansia glycaniphila]|uniref:Tetratricopeptide-like helical domain n=2 Tax=Akkermansia glycaniphila TaxID=1679444 RepID=A0A1H6KGY7_9BACT|nr:tetratricopeptide-like helical domain [Akkermansia glycaniphila]